MVDFPSFNVKNEFNPRTKELQHRTISISFLFNLNLAYNILNLLIKFETIHV